MSFDLSDLISCVCRDPARDLMGKEHGDDFLIVGEVSMTLCEIRHHFMAGRL